MANYCSVDNCYNKVGSGLAFFRCPKDKERCEKWRTALGFAGNHRYANITLEQCNRRIRVCSIHFTKDSFTCKFENQLKPTAIPSLNLVACETDNQAGTSSYEKRMSDACTQTENKKNVFDATTQTDEDCKIFSSCMVQSEDVSQTDLDVNATGSPSETIKIEIKDEPLTECADLLLDEAEYVDEVHTEANDDKIIDNCDEPASVDYNQASNVDKAQMSAENINNITQLTVPTKHTNTFDEEDKKEALKISSNASVVQQEQSECQIFGNLVAKKISKYSPDLLNVVQENIMKILFEADKTYYSQRPLS